MIWNRGEFSILEAPSTLVALKAFIDGTNEIFSFAVRARYRFTHDADLLSPFFMAWYSGSSG